MIVIGVDPGISGGVAAITKAGEFLFAEPMPVLKNSVPTVDFWQLREWIRRYDGVSTFAYVERAQAMPRQGASSGFNYGVVFGSLLTCLTSLCIGYELVSPAKWKRDAGLGSDKNAAIARVAQFYPQLRLRKKDDGLAEALLIARHGAGL